MVETPSSKAQVVFNVWLQSLKNITAHSDGTHIRIEIWTESLPFLFRNGQDAFPPLTVIETSWNGSLGSLCFQEYMEAEQVEPKQSLRGNVTEYPREETDKAVVQFIGKLFLQILYSAYGFSYSCVFMNQ